MNRIILGGSGGRECCKRKEIIATQDTEKLINKAVHQQQGYERSGSSLCRGGAPESSSPAEICVILGESQRAQTPPVTPGTPGSYACGICGKKYKYYNCFQTHVRGHGESDGGSGEGGSQTSNNNFRYTCDVCGKKYKYYSCFQEHRDLHAVDDPYDPVVIPVDDVKEDEQMDRLLKVGPNRKRLERFSQKQLDVLFKEVKARQKKLFGTATQSPCVHEVRTAWEEISLAVSAVSPGSKKTSVQCRKRINDLRRRGRQKFTEIWNGIGSTEGSSPAVSLSAPVEASNARTLKMETMEHLEQTGSDRPAVRMPVPEPPAQQEEMGRRIEETEVEIESGHVSPPLPQELRIEEARARRAPWRQRVWRRGRWQGQWQGQQRPLLQLLSSGFRTLRRELAAVKQSISSLDSSLQRMDSHTHPLMRSVSSSLARIADTMDRQYGAAPACPTPAHTRSSGQSSSEDDNAQRTTAYPRKTPRRAAAIASRLKSCRGKHRR
ncbi:hypothetical protein GJAV_G00043910 [Gymnothorax javanicus]|nr:hypothetical protein GJAV_G00043910 [Gymnothorax javanicus]